MDKYIKYKSDLQNLEYPNIIVFNDDKIKDLFLQKNRCQFLMWIVNSLNEDVTLSADSVKPIENVIADYLHETGFCTLAEKVPFVQCACSIDEDIKIFDRIFNYLSLIQGDVNIDSFENDDQKACSNDFLNRNMNLFPYVRALTVYTEEERKQKFKECKEKIDNLNSLINKDGEIEDNLNINDHIFEEDIISSNTESIKDHIRKLDAISSTIKGTTKQCREGNSFSQNFAGELRKCCDEVGSVLQYFRCMNLMQKIKDDLHDTIPISPSNDLLEIFKCSVETSSKILKSLQN